MFKSVISHDLLLQLLQESMKIAPTFLVFSGDVLGVASVRQAASWPLVFPFCSRTVCKSVDFTFSWIFHSSKPISKSVIAPGIWNLWQFCTHFQQWCYIPSLLTILLYKHKHSSMKMLTSQEFSKFSAVLCQCMGGKVMQYCIVLCNCVTCGMSTQLYDMLL